MYISKAEGRGAIGRSYRALLDSQDQLNTQFKCVTAYLLETDNPHCESHKAITLNSTH